MAHEILLEAGTNEMEILTFKVGGIMMGVNVAKVREVVSNTSVIGMPQSHNAVEGCIKLRDNIITLIDLSKHFAMGEKDAKNCGQTIVIEFNDTLCGIEVDQVNRIYRTKWSEIMPPNEYLKDLDVPITGMVLKEDQIVQIIDLEIIVGGILDLIYVKDVPEELVCDSVLGHSKVLICDDSSVVRQILKKQLENANFTNVTVCSDGQEAYDAIFATKECPEDHFNIILTDVEMPRMDGLHLCKSIKDEPDFNNLPVILVSSLIINENLNKGSSVGADAQIKKSDTMILIHTMQQLLGHAIKQRLNTLEVVKVN